MTFIPLTNCCTMLGIDPKTLRHWLKLANLQFTPHPTDARLKCLTEGHVQQLAALHSRPLASLAPARPALLDGTLPLVPSQGQAPPRQESEAMPVLTANPLSTSASEESALRMWLASLETKVTTLQEQLAHLALELLRERERSVEQRLSTLETLIQQTMKPGPGPGPAPQALQETDRADAPCASPRPERRLVPVELHARSRVIPLIEYGAQSLYVAVCPQEGVLQLAPDSAEWFDWLASLTSFRFVGQEGRFTAYRDTHHGQRTRGWVAHRGIHGRHYKHYLGVTDRLTIDCLEQMAAYLQSRLAAH